MSTSSQTDSDLEARLAEVAEGAAARWDGREEVREARTRALKSGRYLEADSRSRLAMRVNHLLDGVRRVGRNRRPPATGVLAELAARPVPVTPDELTDDLVQEAMLGASSFLSIEFLERGLMAARSVGRIAIKGGGGLRPWGTGFLVAPGLLLTNHHVLASADFAAACVVQMDFEQNLVGALKPAQSFVLEPVRFFLNNKDLDFALVAVAPRSDGGVAIEDYGWLPLVSAQGKIAVTDNDFINIVQHPLGREKEIVLRENRILDLRTENDGAAADLGPFLHYEADTEKGSSGSPVLNDQWEVVALHHSGVPRRDANGNWLNKAGAVWTRAQPLSDVDWIANEGVRISSLVSAVNAASVQPHERDLLDRFLSAQPPTVIGIRSEAEDEGLATAPGPARPGGGAVAGPLRPPPRSSAAPGSIAVDLPLRITISLAGEIESAVASPGPRGEDPEAEFEALSAADFADRRGYDRQFLGRKIALPRLKANPRFGSLLRVARPARPDDEFELRYHRHSVLMNAARRLAYISACNIDFAAPENAGRKEGRTTWRVEPRIDPGHQLGNAYYLNNDYDKGHLTRRDDAAWGATKQQAIAANDDTFFYPNSAPQHFLFNQSDDFTNAGLDLWGDLENFIASQGSGQRSRISIFNGPVFGDNDRPLRDALVPLAFFKIVIWRDGEEEPGALGFVLEQDDLIANVPEEAIDPGRFSIRQRRIADIDAMVDLDFAEVAGFDRMPAAVADEAFGDGGIPIVSVADIRMAGVSPPEKPGRAGRRDDGGG